MLITKNTSGNKLWNIARKIDKLDVLCNRASTKQEQRRLIKQGKRLHKQYKILYDERIYGLIPSNPYKQDLEMVG